MSTFNSSMLHADATLYYHDLLRDRREPCFSRARDIAKRVSQGVVPEETAQVAILSKVAQSTLLANRQDLGGARNVVVVRDRRRGKLNKKYCSFPWSRVDIDAPLQLLVLLRAYAAM